MSFLEDIDKRSLLEFDSDLSKPTLDGFVEIIRRRYSLAHVAYMCPSFGGRERKEPVLAATYSDEWIAHYKEQDYGTIDPVINIGARSLLPVDWAGLPRTGKKVRRLFEEAQDAGIGKQGLTIPMRGPTNGLWALMIATSNDTDSDWKLRSEELTKNLFFVAHQVHHWAYKLHGNATWEHDIDTLSQRETEVLQRFADGTKLADIATSMGLKDMTVKAYLSTVRLKLHAANGSHAVAIAFRAGLIR